MTTSFDISKFPMLVVWEVTKASETAEDPLHGKPGAECDERELSTIEAQKLLGEIAELKPAIFVFTGENALRRPDLCQLVHCAARLGLRPMLAANPSVDLTPELLAELKAAGLSRLQFTLDGSTAELHDLMQGAPGSFACTMEALQWASTRRIPVQINTNVTTRNAHDLEALAPVLKSFRVQLWNVSFPVPSDPEHADDLPSASEFEAIFARLYEISRHVPFKVKTTEAAHYRRFILQQRARTKSGPQQETSEGIPGVMPIHEARATVFISPGGEVYAGACLPVLAGNARFQKLTEIYRHSEVFASLRTPANLTGKCGCCNFKEICGGSRGRALLLLGDMFTEDVSCIYQPPTQTRAKARTEKQKSLENTAIEQAG